jgi:hypothetical protein
VDAIRHLIYDGLFVAASKGLISNDEAISRFRNYMSAVRRGIGEENYLLSCWGMLTPNIGICDGMRFATDASATDSSFRMQIDESARWHHTHGILYLNDPDYICLRQDASPGRSLASFISLNGYLYMISDEISSYDKERLDIIKKTISPTRAVTAETGPINTTIAMNYYKSMVKPRNKESIYSNGSIWATHFSQYGRNWAVVNIIKAAQYEASEKIDIPPENLGLNPDISYAVFDFWKQEPLGFMKGHAPLPVPEYRDCTVVSFTPVSERIEFAASSRHISMDAVSVADMTREKDSLSLYVEGPAGVSADYWFIAPKEAKASDGKAALELEFANEGHKQKEKLFFVKCTITYNGSRQVIKLYC